MDASFAISEAVADAEAYEELAREFPAVPPRIVGSVLSAYRRVKLTRRAAVRAARRRLYDACAI
jgi:hypothetical protein